MQLLNPQNLSRFCVSARELVPGLPQIPKSADAQVTCVKWHRSLHTVSLPHPQTPNHRSKTLQVFIETNVRICGPVQFKLMMFEGQLYFNPDLQG